MVAAKTAELVAGAQAELAEVEAHGGMVAAVESGYIKARLVAAHAARRARMESGEDPVVGVNCFQATEPSPLLSADTDAAIQRVDPASEQEVRAGLADGAAARRGRGAGRARPAQGRRRPPRRQPDGRHPGLRPGRRHHRRVVLRAARGVRRVPRPYRPRRGSCPRPPAPQTWPRSGGGAHDGGRDRGGRLRLLLGKPGLDGHSNGVEQIAVRARDAGFEVIYAGIRLTPGQIAAAAAAEDVHCVGLSILSGGHAELVPEVLRRLRRLKAADIPVVVGGIIPATDARQLRAQGVAAVFTPADFGITAIVGRIVDEIRRAHGLEPVLTMER